MVKIIIDGKEIETEREQVEWDDTIEKEKPVEFIALEASIN